MSDTAKILALLQQAQRDIGQVLDLLGRAEADADKPSVSRWAAALADLEPDKPSGAWGMSDKTAKAQVGMPGGTAATRRVVAINSARALPSGYFADVALTAAERNIPPAVLCAIFCRESNHGAALDARGFGDHGRGFGVGQVDSRYHIQRGIPDPYSRAHMSQCAEIFADFLRRVEIRHPDWRDKYLLRGAAVAYNSGVGNVATIERMDVGTTGEDYGADVMARAQAYAGMEPWKS